MSFSLLNGYTPLSFEQMMEFIREGTNTQFGTAYTTETFVGTGWYKYFYQLLQKVQENEIKTSEIFLKLQEYISVTNEEISRPTVSHPGLLDAFTRDEYIVSIKPPLEADAGKIFVCVDTDDDAPDYDDVRLDICQKLLAYTAGGIVSMGTEVESLVLTNGQAFDFKFNLPDRIPVLLRLTIEESENNRITVPTEEQIRVALFAALGARYRLGLNFEPQRYFTQADAPWSSMILLEWSDNAGADWNSTVFEADYDELFDFDLGDISVVLT